MPEPSKRYSFWKYPKLTRFTNSAPTSATGSPTKTPRVLALAPEEDRPEVKVDVQDTQVRPFASPGVIIACLVCLLIGSLLRSLLSEADFVIYPAEGQASHGEWRELKRLMEWRIGFDRDLIVAVARRNVVN